MNAGETSTRRGVATRPLRASLMLGVSIALLAAPAFARQTAKPTPAPVAVEDDNEVDALTVTAARSLPGAVVGDIPPEVSLSPRDIRAYGVSTVSELITALEPQTSSARGGAAGGRPVMLVNGGRISSFAEVRDIPTEAIARVEILPEEVALKYGYRADQKVVNLVLRRRFRAFTAEGGFRIPTEAGGGDASDIRANVLNILRDNRFLVDLKASGQTALYETERHIAQPRSDAAYRSLLPEQKTWSLNTVYSRPIKNGVSGTINASVDSTDSTSWLGRNTLAGGPLRRESDSTTAHLGGGLLGAIQGWRWALTANAERGKSDSTTDRVISGLGYRDISNSVSTSADGELTVNGTLFRIPAGAVTTTVTGGFETVKLESDSVRAGVARSGELSRDTGSAKLNFDLPLSSVRNDVLAGIGNLSLNLNLAADKLSDFGTLTTIGYGANWSPIDKLQVIASVTRDQGAPTLQQIGDPEQLTPGTQVYDFKRGEAAVISRLTGGNRNLLEEEGRVIKLGLTLKPTTDLTLTTSYTNSRTDNLISSFPTATSQIEDAFPTRFVRDASGRLVQIDARPINFDRRQTDELRTGFTFRKSFGPQPQPGQFRQGQGQGGAARVASTTGQGGAPATGQTAGQPATEAAPPPPGLDSNTSATDARRAAAAGGGGGNFGGPGGGFGGPGPGGGGFRGGPGGFGGGPPGSGTFQIGLYHTVKFTDEITIRPGLAPLDLLNGASIGSGGGTPKNQLDLQANVSRSGLGASMNARWQEGTTVRGSGATGSQDLDFSALTTVNLRLFADLGAQPALRRSTFFRGARVSASVDNLFDAKQKVRAPDGTTPITYQEDYLDPRGRTIRLSFRKVFFPSFPVPPAGAPRPTR
ncbi:TonB-dependent receptor [Caulobacter sp.]|uniref:TonB-dependent receptor n=1 Tax=Caulobacter sp. TaxID=78 RepID=UPI003BABA747